MLTALAFDEPESDDDEYTLTEADFEPVAPVAQRRLSVRTMTIINSEREAARRRQRFVAQCIEEARVDARRRAVRKRMIRFKAELARQLAEIRAEYSR